MDLTKPRQLVARSIQSLEASLASLVESLAHEKILIDLEPAAGSPIRRACQAYSAINYGVLDEVGSSIVCLGVLGVSADILRRAKAVNAAKAALKAVCAPLYGVRIRVPVKGGSSPTKAIAAIRVILRNIQHSDLNLLAAYRKIPILEAPPATVTYTRANTRAVYSKSVEDIMELLEKLETPASMTDRERMASLDRGVTKLALVKQRYMNIRANVLYGRLDSRGRGRIQISAELPVIYPQGRSVGLPEVRFPAEDPDEIPPMRVRRSVLEAEPFLKSIPVYRYLNLGTKIA